MCSILPRLLLFLFYLRKIGFFIAHCDQHTFSPPISVGGQLSVPNLEKGYQNKSSTGRTERVTATYITLERLIMFLVKKRLWKVKYCAEVSISDVNLGLYWLSN